MGWSSLSLGGDGVEIRAVALQECSRERKRIKPQLQTCWTHCSAEFVSFNSVGRIRKTWSGGALPTLHFPGKGLLTPFREMLIHSTLLSHPQPLLTVVESLGCFPDLEDDLSFHFLLKLGMWCRCW